MMQQINRPKDQLSAKLFTDVPPNTVMTLHSFGAMLQKMAGVTTPSEVLSNIHEPHLQWQRCHNWILDKLTTKQLRVNFETLSYYSIHMYSTSLHYGICTSWFPHSHLSVSAQTYSQFLKWSSINKLTHSVSDCHHDQSSLTFSLIYGQVKNLHVQVI